MLRLRSKNQRILVLSLASALLATGSAWAADVDEPTLAQLSFLAGSWSRCTDKAESEELWLPSRGGMMLGLNRTVRSSGESAFEYLRIEESDAGVTYLASPGGRSATPFTLVEVVSNQAVFENPEHDFPTRIIYRLNDDGTLTARIEGLVDGELRESEWHWDKGSCAN
jgi:hypothetical protein